MGRRVYLETSVISYLAAFPSRDVVVAGNQQVTRDWWTRRQQFELFVSEAVLLEARRGDGAAAQRRLALVDSISVLETRSESEGLAASFLAAAALPAKAALDAVHVALAAVHGMDFLSPGTVLTSRMRSSDPNSRFCAGEPGTDLRSSAPH